jgi:hypothetical protein
MIRPLPRGTHTIRVELVPPGGVPTVNEVIVNAAAGQAGSAAR